MKKYDLVVCGGGLAGVGAAVAAAREGLEVLIVERSGSFGGALTNSLVFPFCPYWTAEDKSITKILNDGLFTQMRERAYKMEHPGAEYELASLPISIEGGDTKLRIFSTEHIKAAMDDMIRESGVDVLFHTIIFGVETEGRRVRAIRVATKSGELLIEADAFIDTTGDGDVFWLAGCETLLGREGDNFTQPMTTCYRVCNVDVNAYRRDLPRLQALYKDERAAGRIKNPRENILQFFGLGDGMIHYNTTRIVKHDPTNPIELSRAEMEARSQAIESFNFLKTNCEAFKDAILVSVASEIGVRESRKLVGVHVLTEEELFDRYPFEDSIALGNYDVDIHSPDGTGTRIRKFDRDKYYKIPYRSLLPKEYDNLLVAGRCISATHEAQSSVRIMPICVSMGEAAGVAIAVAKKSGKTTHTLDISALQNRLRELGAAID